MDDKPAKIRVKVGAAEFEAEGPADLVREQYDAFLKIAAAASAAGGSSSANTQSVEGKPPLDTPPAIIPAAPPANGAEGVHVDADILRRVVSERDNTLSLVALPQTEDRDRDALLILLYAFQELRPSEYPVSGFRVIQSALRSGVQVGRVDRLLGGMRQYVLTAGFKRGRKYSLNNQGSRRAVEIIKGIVRGA